jgi:L-methionine (R)-S-oxide reductase
MLPTLPWPSSTDERITQYADLTARIAGLIEGEVDETAIYATAACEIHHAFSHHHWTGFYRHVEADMLVIGPYQGTHGCLRIPFGEGVCGRAARSQSTLVVPDVRLFEGHIACSTSTRSEIVVPLVAPDGSVLGVLDIDSDHVDAFDDLDRACLERIAHLLSTALAETSSIR